MMYYYVFIQRTVGQWYYVHATREAPTWRYVEQVQENHEEEKQDYPCQLYQLRREKFPVYNNAWTEDV